MRSVTSLSKHLNTMKRTPIKRKVPLRAKNSTWGILGAKKPYSKTLPSKIKRKKKTPLKKLKEKLWALCREIQIKKYGRNCYTCSKIGLEGSNCHLGHFIPSSVCSTPMRYYLDNLRPQCYHCNINLSGNWIEYEKHLIRDGIDTENLKWLNEQSKGGMFREDWYEQKIREYEDILETL